MPASHLRALVPVPAALFMVWIPVNVSYQAVSDDTSSWAPATHVGDLDGILAFQLQPGPALTVMGV